MDAKLIRNEFESGPGYTLGRLFVDEGGFLCWILEPEDRHLHQDMELETIKARKVKGKTAIPAGRYRIRLRKSPSFGGKWYAQPYGGKMPYLWGVPGFESVMIHPGNRPEDTAGCLLPGMRQHGIRGQVFESVKAWQDLMKFYIWPAYQRGEEIWLTIE